MSNDISPKKEFIIPENEVEVTTSRSGGAGGQHVNKTDSRITLRWNVINTTAFSFEQKARILEALRNRLTVDGDLIINNSESRSQQQNRILAFEQLERVIKQALYVPKKRRPTKVSRSAKETRLQNKAQRSKIKKLRKIEYD